MTGLLSVPDEPWTHRAVVFNLAPATYIHDSWLETLPHGELVGILKREPDALASVSQFLLDALHLRDGYFCDFAEPRSRLALLDSAVLEKMFLYAGLALRSEEIRGEIDGVRLGRLREALGASALEFAVKRAPLLGKLPLFDYEPAASNLRVRLTLIGAMYALSPAHWNDPAYSRRVILKLPRGLSEELQSTLPEHPRGDPGPELPGLARRLIREFAPEWQALFA